MSIDISIIIPAYNVEELIGRCIESVTNQSNVALEVILINDASTDNTEERILEYQAKDDRIIYINQKFNQGQGYARNVAIKNARGKYLLFIDSDDYIQKDCIADLFEIANKLSLDILEANYYTVVNGKNIKRNLHLFGQPLNGEQYLAEIPYRNSVIWNKLWSKEFLQSNHLEFKKEIFEDSRFICDALIYTKRIFRVDKPFYYYIVHENSTMTSKVSHKHLYSHWKLLEHLDKNIDKTLGNEGTAQRVKTLIVEIAGLSKYLKTFIPSNDKEISDYRTAKKLQKKLHKKYRLIGLKNNKMMLVQKIAFYTSPSLLYKLTQIAASRRS